MSLIGFILVLFLSYKNTAKVCQKVILNSRLEMPSKGITQVIKKIEKPQKQSKQDRRLTGANIIDEQLQEVLRYAFRDYICTWYSQISDNEEYLISVQEMVQKVIIAFASRSKEVEWVPYLTTRLVDDFASHLRLFRQAQTKLKVAREMDSSNFPNLHSLFFDLETTMEQNLCRDLVSTSSEHEKAYLRELAEVLLYLLLPQEDFHNKLLRYIVREIVVNIVLLPLINLFSDPDYINQTIVWLCKDSLITSEGFLLVLRCTDNADELLAVKEIVKHEIAVQRSRDTGEQDDAEIKQQLSSLWYVQKVINTRLQRLEEGSVDTDSTGLPTDIDWKQLTDPGVKLFSLPFHVIMTNGIALYYFTEFMTNIGANGYVAFYNAVEGFRASAEQVLSDAELRKGTESSATPPDLEMIRRAALQIYEFYLSEKASLKIKLDEGLLKKLLCRIRTEKPNETWFDEAQAKVYDIMQDEPYFPTFMKTSSYIKLLAELDLLKDIGKSDDESASNKSGGKCPSEDLSYDNLSLNSLDQDDDGLDYLTSDLNHCLGRVSPVSSSDECIEDCFISAEIYNTGITNHSGRTFAVYAICVTRRDAHRTEERWYLVRRYSDFHDFHMSVIEKFPHLSSLKFPGKKTFNNLARQFLEKRAEQLNEYLQIICSSDMLNSNQGLFAMLLNFLEPKIYERGRRPLSKTVGTLVNPLKSSVKSMGNMVKTMPDTFIDGLRDGLFRVLGSKWNPSLNPGLVGSGKVAAGIDIEGEDNIPLRIMLLLMDEVFDLKCKDQWFRRRIVILLRQIMNATFGDKINRKIVDYVEWMTSADQVAEYVKALRQSLWPNGSLALPSAERDYNTKMRTRVAAKMVTLCSIPDELKHVIGTSTTRKGVLCVFEMFQHPELNRRLVYVLLEGIIETLFPKNQFSDIFRKLHSSSPHTSETSNQSDKQINHQNTQQKR